MSFSPIQSVRDEWDDVELDENIKFHEIILRGDLNPTDSLADHAARLAELESVRVRRHGERPAEAGPCLFAILEEFRDE